ncbi:MAG TPA: glycosyltransferase 87 family protein, partial [Streptosporangiaceae bacterium]
MLVLLGSASVLGAILLAAADAAGHQIDFDIYRMGAGQVMGPHLYDVRLSRSLMGGRRGMQFTYPPFAALLFWPFTQLSVPAAQLAWSVLNTGALLGLIGLSLSAARPHWPARQTWSLAACALLPALRLNPNGLTLGLGQVNFFIALLVLADLTGGLKLRGRTLPRGLLVGIAAAIKLTPLIFIPFLVLTRQLRAAVTASVTFLICSLGMFAVASQSSRRYWTTEIFDDKRSGNLLHISDQNLHSALQRVLGHAPGPLLAGTLTILLACAGLAVATWAHRASSPLLGLLACAATGLIVSPVSWIHHYVWVVPALAWLAFATDRPRGGRWWALGLAVLLWAAPPWWVPDQQQGYGDLAVLL